MSARDGAASTPVAADAAVAGKAGVTKREVQETSIAARVPPKWWAPAAHELESDAPHDIRCGVCQEGVEEGATLRCVSCPASFHEDCAASGATVLPPVPGSAAAARWQCPTCIVRTARGITGPLRCNFCCRAGGRQLDNRLLVTVLAGVHDRVAIAHKICAEYCSGHNGQPYDPTVLARELHRARQLKCALCGAKGAATGCMKHNCNKSFHVQCALEQPGQVAFGGSAMMACAAHHAALPAPDGPLRRMPPPAAPSPATSPSAPRPGGSHYNGPKKRKMADEAGRSGEFEPTPEPETEE